MRKWNRLSHAACKDTSRSQTLAQRAWQERLPQACRRLAASLRRQPWEAPRCAWPALPQLAFLCCEL